MLDYLSAIESDAEVNQREEEDEKNWHDESELQQRLSTLAR